eukprot:TRINITY_DN9024_c0_g1_i1.p1 TRINITY_DN9024_c0_g1~~TRINITY_DN9024_c0_g1_i1.p1  ORF type:complete len:632 (+),score=135.54 TRINITY_DN9024_c0_g1_i1:32-1927(+)
MYVRPPHSASLYVGDLHPEVTEAMLFEAFKEVGPVLSIRVCRDAVTRRSLGYAYVNFQNPQDAERCIEALNFTKIKDRSCRIMWSQRDPTLRKTNRGNIFIKNLPKDIEHKALHDTFSAFGNILSCKVVTNSEGESLGYGFVHFESDEAAQAAIDKVNGMLMNGQQVIVAPFERRQKRWSHNIENFTNLYVKHLDANVTQEQLKELFEKYGETTSVVVAIRPDGASRGFGFVNYKDHNDAVKAVDSLHDTPQEKNGVSLPNRPLYVARHQRRAERQVLRDQWAKERQMRLAKYVNLYIKNLDDTIDDAKLKEAFDSFGTIISAKVMKDEITGISKGVGFVSFRDSAAADKAVEEMNNKIGFSSKPLYVCRAMKRDERRTYLEMQFGRTPRAPGGYPGSVPSGIPAGGIPAGGNYYPSGPAHQQQYIGGYPGAGVPQHQAGNYFQHQQQQRLMQPAGPRWEQQAGAQTRMMMGMPRAALPVRPAGRFTAPQGVPPRGIGNPGAMALRPHGAATGIARPPLKPSVPSPFGASGLAKPPARLPLMGVPGESISAATLAAMSPDQQKNALGERLFSNISEEHPLLAAKITGMLLEMDNGEILNLLESPQLLRGKVQEAIAVLNAHPEEMKAAHTE